MVYMLIIIYGKDMKDFKKYFHIWQKAYIGSEYNYLIISLYILHKPDFSRSNIQKNQLGYWHVFSRNKS